MYVYFAPEAQISRPSHNSTCRCGSYLQRRIRPYRPTHAANSLAIQSPFPRSTLPGLASGDSSHSVHHFLKAQAPAHHAHHADGHAECYSALESIDSSHSVHHFLKAQACPPGHHADATGSSRLTMQQRAPLGRRRYQSTTPWTGRSMRPPSTLLRGV